MLAAWLNVRPDQIPPANRAHLCPHTMAAWRRVGEAALDYHGQAGAASLEKLDNARIESYQQGWDDARKVAGQKAEHDFCHAEGCSLAHIPYQFASCGCIHATAPLIAERDALREALTPSNATKAAYQGEFIFSITRFDDDGEEYLERHYVPWTAVKEIMAAIAARATITAHLEERRND
jgi:hypothetical protein